MKWDIFSEIREVLIEMGGKGSGHWQHAGRQGKVGGSAPSKGGARTSDIIQKVVTLVVEDKKLHNAVGDAINEVYSTLGTSIESGIKLGKENSGKIVREGTTGEEYSVTWRSSKDVLPLVDIHSHPAGGSGWKAIGGSLLSPTDYQAMLANVGIQIRKGLKGNFVSFIVTPNNIQGNKLVVPNISVLGEIYEEAGFYDPSSTGLRALVAMRSAFENGYLIVSTESY